MINWQSPSIISILNKLIQFIFQFIWHENIHSTPLNANSFKNTFEIDRVSIHFAAISIRFSLKVIGGKSRLEFQFRILSKIFVSDLIRGPPPLIIDPRQGINYKPSFIFEPNLVLFFFFFSDCFNHIIFLLNQFQFNLFFFYFFLYAKAIFI